MTKSPSTEAFMYFDYGDCAGASVDADTKATLAVKLEKVAAPTRPDAVVEFVNFLCHHDTVGAHEVAKVKLTATETYRGKGKCKADSVLMTYSNPIASNATCRSLCVEDIVKYSPECEAQSGVAAELVCMNAKKLCKGYSYSSTTEKCITYTGGNITTTTGEDGDWTCKSTDLAKTDWSANMISTTTAPPPLLKGTNTATKATIKTFESKKGCFAKFDWITLQEATGKEATFQVPAASWDTLMKSFKLDAAVPGRRLSTAIEAKLSMDLATYGLPGAAPAVVTPAPTTTAAPVAAKAASSAAAVKVKEVTVEEEDCVVPEVMNALLSGVAVPVAAWVAVAFYAKTFAGTSLEGGISKPYEMIGVAVVAALVVSIVLVFVVAFILKPLCDSSQHDIRIVTISICMATMCGCAIAIYGGSRMSKTEKKQKFMMVSVDEEGQTQPLKSHEMVKDHEHDNVMSSVAKK
jgi:hypothetical protein